MIKITFPDGSVREYNEGVTGLQIAESISSRLAQDVLWLLYTSTGRVKELVKMFPNAKFIYLMRNPYTVFESTRS